MFKGLEGGRKETLVFVSGSVAAVDVAVRDSEFRKGSDPLVHPV